MVQRISETATRTEDHLLGRFDTFLSKKRRATLTQEDGIPEKIVLIEEPGWIHDHKLYLSPRMWIEHVCHHPEKFANCGQGSTAASPCSHLVRILTDIGRAGNSLGDSEGCGHIQ